MVSLSQANRLLRERFGFPEFRSGQERVIQALLDDGRALAVFPTGGGKSLCYQLPALLIEGVTLVVSPLIALMKDQIDFLRSKGIPAARLDSSLGIDETREVTRQIAEGTLKLLYVAPERFNNERFLGEIKRIRVGLFAIDEAHCISEWGHNFRPDYLKLSEIAREIGAERILTLTATATPAVVQDICKSFDIPDRNAVVTGFYRPNLTLLTTPTSAAKRDALLVQRMRELPKGSTIIYVTLQRTAERVATMLSRVGFPAEAYHAGMEADERNDIQNRWMARDDGVVVATIAFGMGIDKADVRNVIHYNLPKSLESYSQEIGRAGRDGQPSTVELLASRVDLPALENFAYGDTPTEAALNGLVQDLFSREEEFDLSLYDLSATHDLRPLVLRTALTYLELLGALKRGTPFYAGYQFRPTSGIEKVLSEFDGKHGEFVKGIVDHYRQGRTWYGVDPASIAESLSVERRRVIRALEVLEERNLIELKASDVRDRYRRLVTPEARVGLVRELAKRFLTRERHEIERLNMVPALVEHRGCQTNHLVGYFGEVRPGRCGHCSYCLSGQAQTIPKERIEPIESVVSMDQILGIAASYPKELGSPRQMARFLCGLSSPWFTKAKLSRHALFGVAEDHPFMEVMAYVTTP